MILSAVKNCCLAHGFNQTYWVAYSGGLDSHVLLHLLATLRLHYPLKLRAIHINHGLSRNASSWSEHCVTICKTLKIDLLTRTINIPSSLSLEEQARQLRYQEFATLLAANDVLMTAHHQDDQAETVFIQMLRGAGPKGLAAMPVIKPFGKGWLMRPLLSISRAQLKQYAEENKLHWIDDESNINTRFMRNFLRHDIFPILKQRLPSLTSTIARVAENCAEAQCLLDDMGKEDLLKIKGNAENRLNVKKLLTFSSVRQRNILRTWFAELHFPMPTAIKLQQIQHDMLQAREDKTPYFTWEQVELRRYQNELYALPCLMKWDEAQEFEWDLSQTLTLPNQKQLTARLAPGGLRTDIKKVWVRFRQGGEYFQPINRAEHHSLKKLFQEWGIPPWERQRIPLIYIEEKLAAVVGWSVSKAFAVSPDELGYVFDFR